MPKRGPLLTVRESAERARVTDRTFYTWITEGKVPPYIVLKLGGRIRIDETLFEEWLSDQGTPDYEKQGL